MSTNLETGLEITVERLDRRLAQMEYGKKGCSWLFKAFMMDAVLLIIRLLILQRDNK